MMIQGTQATAAGGTTANVLVGQLYETAPDNGWVRFMGTGEAAGESRMTLYVGGRVIVPESSMSRAARVPIEPDDIIATTWVRRGDKLTWVHRNTGAGSNTIFWRVDFRPR